MMDYENENRGYDDAEPARDSYQRDDRSMSPRGRRDSPPRHARDRSASPGGKFGDRSDRRDDRRDTASNVSDRDARNNGAPPADAANTGTNLFVTGIHPRLTEDDVTRLFQKYGEVEKCQIMVDPHTKESRGFGFVKMATLEHADAAKEGLQGEVFEGRTLSIEKARRNRPRTPTPGKYFGPPKREEEFGRRGPPRYGDDRRFPPRRHFDDYDRSGGYSSRYDDRDRGERHYRSREPRDDYGAPRGADRYGGRDDRYGGSRGDDRYARGGDDRRPPRESYGYGSGDRDAGYSRAPPASDAPRGPEGGRPYGGGYDADRNGGYERR
ncbi:RNA-binding domain-containing protein [Ascodesmis nigricans]|uniref:RNA-binding domain-containing protein n=1 Tax=Ascodesmis nigricans TaxID=341454 RepID=A0A4S2MTS4_9PEZI|nr:RNA-binding domain-containing protein [Ascodesmis nigricans]